jgi:hypothetical protein
MNWARSGWWSVWYRAVLPSAQCRRRRWLCRDARTPNRAGHSAPAARAAAAEHLRAVPLASHPQRPQAPIQTAVFHTGLARIPCGRCTPHSVPRCTSFFPRRLQIAALKQDADRLPAHLRRQLPLFRTVAIRRAPPRSALWWRTTQQGDDGLALNYVQRSLFSGSRLFVQGRLQSLLLITPGNSSHRFRSYAQTCHHPRHFMPMVELAQDRSTPQHTRQISPPGQHRKKLLPMLLQQLEMHPMVATHVLTMRPFRFMGK